MSARLAADLVQLFLVPLYGPCRAAVGTCAQEICCNLDLSVESSVVRSTPWTVIDRNRNLKLGLDRDRVLHQNRVQDLDQRVRMVAERMPVYIVKSEGHLLDLVAVVHHTVCDQAVVAEGGIAAAETVMVVVVEQVALVAGRIVDEVEDVPRLAHDHRSPLVAEAFAGGNHSLVAGLEVV